LDTYCYTAAIEACANAKLWRKALELLQEMEARGIAPSEVTYSVTITACGNGGEWQKALDLLQLMREKNMSINLITYNAAITALSKAAKLQSSKNKQQQTSPSEGGLYLKVLELLEQMKANGLEPDGFSFCSAISCCGAEGRWEEALELMQVMQDGGPRTRPNKIAYTAAIASCGRSGQVDHAQRLFRQMKEQGLSADRVAYNALFLALRVARSADAADAAAELWEEMIGTKQPSAGAKIATARADISTTPDIISLTDAIGAMSSVDSDLERVNRVFAEAVQRGIVLHKNTLDSTNDFDLSGMSLPVARAACRYILKRFLATHEEEELADLTFITGVGARKRHVDGDETIDDERSMTSLREYVQEVLATDFNPSLDSAVPRLAQGTVVVEMETLREWRRNQADT
jgi:pentatricopeptide repeat protein